MPAASTATSTTTTSPLPTPTSSAAAARCRTTDGWYRFRTIKPGPYPWRNRLNDWRPAHIHYSIFGHAFVTRLITQLYFEGDPLLRYCPIYHSIPDAGARERLVATLDLDETIPLDTIAYRFDIVLRGRRQTPFENKLQGSLRPC